MDEFGFIHELKTEGLQLHQAAQQLLRHYSCAQEEHENHARRWRSMMEEMSGEGAVNKRVNLEKSFKKLVEKHSRCVVKLQELKMLCRRGIPSQFRGEVWRCIVYEKVKDIRRSRGEHYYTHLLSCLHDNGVGAWLPQETQNRDFMLKSALDRDIGPNF